MNLSNAIVSLFCLASASVRAAPGQPVPGPYHLVNQERRSFAWGDTLRPRDPQGVSGYNLKLVSDTLLYVGVSPNAGARLCLQGTFSFSDYGGVELDSCGLAPDTLIKYFNAIETMLRPPSPSRMIIGFPGSLRPVFFDHAMDGDTLVMSTYWIHLQNEVITFLPGGFPVDTVELLCHRWIAKNQRLKVLDSQHSLSGEIDRYVWKLLPGRPTVAISAPPARRPSARRDVVDARGRSIRPAVPGIRAVSAYPGP